MRTRARRRCARRQELPDNVRSGSAAGVSESGVRAFERQPRETRKAFHAWQVCRDWGRSAVTKK